MENLFRKATPEEEEKYLNVAWFRPNSKEPELAKQKKVEKKVTLRFTIYRDSFMSGWGLAPRGSLVVCKGTLNRRDFQDLGKITHLKSLKRFLELNKEGLHIVAVLPDRKKGKHAYKYEHALNRYTRECERDKE